MNVTKTFERLKHYVEKEGFKGWDPYDGLNSKLFQAIPFLSKSRICRLIWIQFFKKSPLNFRRFVGIKKGYNSKGLSLFLSGYCNLYNGSQRKEYLDRINELAGLLQQRVCEGYSGAAWGYNFDWQARAFFQPTRTPSIVVTSFAGCALLDAYQITKKPSYLKMARSACDFIRYDLYRTYDKDQNFAFSYCPLDKTQVFNASLLGSRLLSRVYAYTSESILLEESKKALSYVSNFQLPDGAWPYSPLPYHQWIDNFHTGFNLEGIYTYMSISKDTSLRDSFERGLQYYLSNFFEEDGAPKYYNHKLYPVDMHNTSQLIITLSRVGEFNNHKDLIDKVLSWSIENMFNPSQGYFYYSKWKYYTNRISYMRWTQAWMFYAISEYMLNTKTLEA